MTFCTASDPSGIYAKLLESVLFWKYAAVKPLRKILWKNNNNNNNNRKNKNHL